MKRADLIALYEWLREPDYAENFSLEDMSEWMNRRPVAMVSAEVTTPSGQFLPNGHVAIPQSREEAEMMNILSERFLWPERFATASPLPSRECK